MWKFTTLIPLLLSLCFYLLSPPAFAQVVSRTKSFRSVLPRSTVAKLPASPATGKIRIVTDGATDSDCEVGGGVNDVLCFYDSDEDNWFSLGDGGGGASIDAAFDVGKEIDGATSKVNAFRVGNGTEAWCFYHDGSDLVFESCNAADTITAIADGQKWCLYSANDAADVLCYDPEQANENAKWTFTAKPLKSVYWSAGAISANTVGDTTDCNDASEVTINSGPKLFTIICADNDAAVMHGSVVMPDSWDAGTLTFEANYIQTAADTNALHMDIKAQCRNDGTVVNSTYGTEVAMDDAALVGSSSIDVVVSAAVTADGTCVAGDLLSWQLAIDAGGTTTAVATLNFIGVKMEYSVDSFSD